MKNKPNFFFYNRGSPNWGGGWGGPPLGNFPHIISFFVLSAFLFTMNKKTMALVFFILKCCNSSIWRLLHCSQFIKGPPIMEIGTKKGFTICQFWGSGGNVGVCFSEQELLEQGNANLLLL